MIYQIYADVKHVHGKFLMLLLELVSRPLIQVDYIYFFMLNTFLMMYVCTFWGGLTANKVTASPAAVATKLIAELNDVCQVECRQSILDSPEVFIGF